MKRFPDILLMVIAVGTILCCSLSAPGFFRNKSKKYHPTQASIIPASITLQSGDLIFRDGKNFISKSLRQFNRKDSRFSHAGIIHIQEGNAYVFHCIGGEGNADNKMRKEKLPDFCSSDEINTFAIYRPELKPEQVRATDSIAQEYFNKGIEFDTQFSLETSDKMYCTEMIYNIYKEVLRENNFIPLSSISGLKYVSCDDIFLQKPMKELYTHSYNSPETTQTAFHEKSAD